VLILLRRLTQEWNTLFGLVAGEIKQPQTRQYDLKEEDQLGEFSGDKKNVLKRTLPKQEVFQKCGFNSAS